MTWETPKDAPVPDGCNPCRWCGRACMEVRIIESDWYGRGRVIRIESACRESDPGDVTLDEAMNREDEVRTEFAPEVEAVAEWNAVK